MYNSGYLGRIAEGGISGHTITRQCQHEGGIVGWDKVGIPYC